MLCNDRPARCFSIYVSSSARMRRAAERRHRDLAAAKAAVAHGVVAPPLLVDALRKDQARSARSYSRGRSRGSAVCCWHQPLRSSPSRSDSSLHGSGVEERATKFRSAR